MTNAQGLFPHTSRPDPEILLSWLKQNGSFVHDDLEIAVTATGWGVKSTSPIQADELLLSSPKTAVLSARTTSLNLPDELILPIIDKDTSSVATNRTIPTLALVVLHEIRLGEAERFWGYLQSLPREVCGLPAFWDEEGEGRKWLKGTEADRELLRRKEAHMALDDLKIFYETTKSLLPPTSAHPNPSSVEAYLYAYSLVTTRAFLIDIYHTLALVPFADILNHSPTAPHTSLASDDFVCHICGSLGSCPHDSRSSDSENIPERLSHLDPMTRARLEREVDTIEMRAEREIQSGEEVMNTYGQGIGDAKLLVDWGFIAGEYTGPGIQWDLDELLPSGTSSHSHDNNDDPGHSVRRRCREAIDRGIIALDLFPDQDQESVEHEENDNLLCAPYPNPGGGGDEPIFNLSQEGQISLSIWITLYLASLPKSKLSVKDEKLDSQLVKSVKLLESAYIDPSPRLPVEIARTCRAVVGILEKRLKGMYRPEMEVEAILDLRDGLEPEENDLRMALTLTVDERVLLISALSEWRALVGRLRERN